MYYRNKYKENRIQKMCKSSQLRDNNTFKKKVFFDKNKMDFDIIKLKNEKDIMDFLACKKNWDDDKIFLMQNKSKFSTLLFKTNVDIVCCDINWKIVDIINNCKPNTEIKSNNKIKNIWVMKENLSIFLNLKLDKKFTYMSI